MVYFKTIALMLSLLMFYVTSGQDVATDLKKDDALIENVHLHLNKTIFSTGEQIWFKAYVFDQLNGLPSSSTTNLHVALFSVDGVQKVKKMYLVNSGLSEGSFKIDSTFVDDSYTLMAWTNYMKNNESATPFLQRIKILENQKNTLSNSNGSLTISIHPEGQQIVNNTFNNVGFTLYDQASLPVETSSIRLVNDSGETVKSKISSNKLGQGRFRFFAHPNRLYSLEVKGGDGKWTSQKLAGGLNSGVGISLENQLKDVVVLRPQFSSQNKREIARKRFTVAIYKDDEISFSQNFVFSQDTQIITVRRDLLQGGVNCAVILDDQKRVLSKRLFYNGGNRNKEVHSVLVNYRLSQNQDSLEIELKLPSGQASANLSMSVLPSETKAYFPNNSIGSSFLAQPYLRQQFHNGAYFFGSSDRSISYQLDTRLLMDGDNTSTWPPRPITSRETRYKKEKFIAIKGKVTDANTEKEKQVSVFSQSLGDLKLLELSSNKDFQGNLILFEGDSLMISVLSKKGKLRKPKVKLYPSTIHEIFFDYSKWLGKTSNRGQGPLLVPSRQDLTISRDAILLDEVIVKGQAKKPTRFTLTTEIEGRIIESSDLKKYNTLATYIRRLGFQMRPDDRNGGIGIFVYDAPGLYPVPVIVDGVLANPVEIMNMPLAGIKALTYNRRVTPHQGPFISISLHYDFDDVYGREKFESLPVSIGFSRTQAYFSPPYLDFNTLVYKHYGAIWWEGQIEVDSVSSKQITIPLNNQKAVKLIIEGMSADGTLFQSTQLCEPFRNMDK